jgi:uncharacterized protein with HEPN domain
MSRDYRLYLQDVFESCEKVITFTDGFTFEKFSSDAKTIDAVARNLEIIGEAIKNVPMEILERQPNIDWKEIARFRDVIAHHYFRVKLTVVWDIIQNRIDEVMDAAHEIISTLPETE